MTQFVEDAGGEYFLARGEDGDALGICLVEDFDKAYGEGTMVGIRVIGHQKATFEGPLTESQVETYREFELFPDLPVLDVQHIAIKTMGSGEVDAVQVTYKVPGHDYPFTKEERNTVALPIGTMWAKGCVRK